MSAAKPEAKKSAKVTRIYDTKFAHDRTHMPVTMQQFQDLTNEILLELNKLPAPHMLDADYVAQVLMSAIHSVKGEIGFISKYAMFESCVHRISCHLTYDAVQEIQKRIKEKNKPEDITVVPAEPNSEEEVVMPAQAAEASAESSVH